METIGGEEKREKGRKAGKKKERWGFIEEGQETNGLGLASRAKAQHAANPRSCSTPPPWQNKSRNRPISESL